MHTRSLIATSFLTLLILAGCATPPPPAPVAAEAPDVVEGNLVYRADGFMDARTGWIYPQTLRGELAATQAWDRDRTLIGIAYTPGAPGPQLAMQPVPVPEAAAESGTVTLIAYPAGYQAADAAGIPDAGNLPRLLGLGHGQAGSEAEFWAYQKALEAGRYNLWKLAKLADADAPGRVFHSLLVLKKLDARRSDALVVTVGQVEGVYSLVVIRRFVRTTADVDAFGDWAYAILQEFGLAAAQG